jgi:hypothetical protein
MDARRVAMPLVPDQVVSTAAPPDTPAAKAVVR